MVVLNQATSCCCFFCFLLFLDDNNAVLKTDSFNHIWQSFKSAYLAPTLFGCRIILPHPTIKLPVVVAYGCVSSARQESRKRPRVIHCLYLTQPPPWDTWPQNHARKCRRLYLPKLLFPPSKFLSAAPWIELGSASSTFAAFFTQKRWYCVVG